MSPSQSLWCGLRKQSSSCSRAVLGTPKKAQERWIPDRVRDDVDPRSRWDESVAAKPLGSLDLGFLELDVLARLRVVFLEAQLLGLRARILLGHIEETRVGGADEL